MKLLFDFFPILIFFVVFKFFGIYWATGGFIIASTLQIGYSWFRYRRVEKMHLITFILGFCLGVATLLLHDIMFIKWKPTAIYWVFGIAFLGSQFIGKKTLIQRMMESNIALPQKIWGRLNLSWTVFFVAMGLLNLYVVYHFDTNTWVNFKLFGMLGITLVFVVIQALFLGRHIRSEEEKIESR